MKRSAAPAAAPFFCLLAGDALMKIIVALRRLYTSDGSPDEVLSPAPGVVTVWLASLVYVLVQVCLQDRLSVCGWQDASASDRGDALVLSISWHAYHGTDWLPNEL